MKTYVVEPIMWHLGEALLMSIYHIWCAMWEKRPLCHMPTATIQMSVRIHVVWSWHPLYVNIILQYLLILWAGNKGPDQPVHAQADQGLCYPQNAYRPFLCIAHFMFLKRNKKNMSTFWLRSAKVGAMEVFILFLLHVLFLQPVRNFLLMCKVENIKKK